MNHATDFEAYLKQAINAWSFSGAVLVKEQGKEIFCKGYGNANDSPNTCQTIFHIASLTKQFTATAILKLAEEKKLSLDDRIIEHLPKKNHPKGNQWDEITIHQLLVHTSGIPNFNKPFEVPEFSESTIYNVDELVDLFKDKTLVFDPDSNRKYNNSAFILLGIIIESVSGMNFGNYLHQTIFSKLDMNATGMIGDENYFKKHRAIGFIPAPYDLYIKAFSTGGMYSNCEDLEKWEKSLETNLILSKESLKLMFQPKQIPGYGYGWFLDDAFGRKRILHHGHIAGYFSSFTMYPEEKSSLIILSNSNFPTSKISDDLSCILFDEPYTLPRHVSTIDKAHFKMYQGNYQLTNNQIIKIVADKNQKVFFEFPEEPLYELMPLSETIFIYKKWMLEFVWNDSSKIYDRLKITIDDEGSNFATKIA